MVEGAVTRPQMEMPRIKMPEIKVPEQIKQLPEKAKQWIQEMRQKVGQKPRKIIKEIAKVSKEEELGLDGTPIVPNVETQAYSKIPAEENKAEKSTDMPSEPKTAVTEATIISSEGKAETSFEEKTIQDIVHAANQFLIDIDKKHEDLLTRKDQCREASSAVKYFAEKLGISVEIFDVNNLQSVLLNRPGLDTFIHTFALATIENNHYLIDTTFGQFILPDGTIGQSGKTTGIPTSNALATQLIHEGYIRLTPEVLAEYFKITSFRYHDVNPIDIKLLTHDLASLPVHLAEKDKAKAYDKYLSLLEGTRKLDEIAVASDSSKEVKRALPLRNAVQVIDEEIKRRNPKYVMFGENHQAEFDLKFPLDLLDVIKANGGKFVFLEEFKTPELDHALTQYMENGIMTPDLKLYLEEGGIREGYGKMKHPYKRQLIEKCRILGLTPVFVDDRNERGIDKDEDSLWMKTIDDSLKNDPQYPAFVITGRIHAYHGYTHTYHGRPTFPTLASRLDEQYGRDKILSIISETISGINGHEGLEKKFIEEITRLEDNAAQALVVDEDMGKSIIQPNLNIKADVMDIMVGGLGQNLAGKRIEG